MTAITILKVDDAPRMAHLHSAAFPAGETWSAADFTELMAQGSVMAHGVEGELALDALILFQKAAPDAEILTLATAPTARRNGIAAGLLAGCLPILNQHHIFNLLLEVAEDNAGARHFYARNHFQETGRRKRYYRRANGERVDAILMSRALSGHNTPERA